MVVTHKSLTVWGHIMHHQKAEKIAYHNGIRDFQSFGQFEIQKLSSVQPLFCLETEISSEVDLQNSVTSKPFGG
jgi:flagellar assembly factor FliW